jgi:hypothetical protein
MLIFENKIKSNKIRFIEDVVKYSYMLGINPNWLMFVMNFESGGTFNPAIQNPYTKGTGLIQFMPSTAKWLGTNIEALRTMSNVQQLFYVYKYFKGRKYNSIFDLYLVTFYPYALGKPDTYVFGTERSLDFAKLIKKQNPALGLKNRDTISLGEWKTGLWATIVKMTPTHYLPEFEKKNS